MSESPVWVRFKYNFVGRYIGWFWEMYEIESSSHSHKLFKNDFEIYNMIYFK